MKDQRLNIRITAEAKSLVEEAADATSVTASAFVVQAALRSAQEVLADQTRFILPPETWTQFTARSTGPHARSPHSKRAASRPSPFSER